VADAREYDLSYELPEREGSVGYRLWIFTVSAGRAGASGEPSFELELPELDDVEGFERLWSWKLLDGTWEASARGGDGGWAAEARLEQLGEDEHVLDDL